MNKEIGHHLIIGNLLPNLIHFADPQGKRPRRKNHYAEIMAEEVKVSLKDMQNGRFPGEDKITNETRKFPAYMSAICLL